MKSEESTWRRGRLGIWLKYRSRWRLTDDRCDLEGQKSRTSRFDVESRERGTIAFLFRPTFSLSFSVFLSVYLFFLFFSLSPSLFPFKYPFFSPSLLYFSNIHALILCPSLSPFSFQVSFIFPLLSLFVPLTFTFTFTFHIYLFLSPFPFYMRSFSLFLFYHSPDFSFLFPSLIFI